MLRATPLLVPPAVTTVTVTVPGTVNELVPFPVGTTTTMPLADQPEAFGMTVAVMLVEAWVKTTLPGALRKPLPFISIGSPTGLEGSVELLIFKIEGTGSGGVLDPPPEPPEPPEQATKSAAAVTMMAAPTAMAHFLGFVFIFGVSQLPQAVQCKGREWRNGETGCGGVSLLDGSTLLSHTPRLSEPKTASPTQLDGVTRAVLWYLALQPSYEWRDTETTGRKASFGTVAGPVPLDNDG